MSKIFPIIACLIAVAFGLMFARSRSALSAAKADADAARAEKEQLAQRVAELENKTVPQAELARLRAEQQEAIRLRGEVTRLRQENSAATAAAARAAAAPRAQAAPEQQAQQEEPAAPVQVRTFSLQARGAVPSGSTMSVGGWETKPGVHTFAFVTPVSNGQNVSIQTRWIEGPREVVQSLNQFGEQVSRGARLLTPDQATAFLAALEGTEGVNFISAPALETASGREASMAVGASAPGPNGTTVHLGPELTLTPVVGANGSVDLHANARVTVPVETPAR